MKREQMETVAGSGLGYPPPSDLLLLFRSNLLKVPQPPNTALEPADQVFEHTNLWVTWRLQILTEGVDL